MRRDSGFRAAGLLLIALGAVGCDRTEAAGKIVHPTAENIPADAGLADVISMHGRATGELRNLGERLARPRPALPEIP